MDSEKRSLSLTPYASLKIRQSRVCISETGFSVQCVWTHALWALKLRNTQMFGIAWPMFLFVGFAYVFVFCEKLHHENSKDFCREISSVTSLDSLVEALLHSATYFQGKSLVNVGVSSSTPWILASWNALQKVSCWLLLSIYVEMPNFHWLLWLRWPCWCPCPQCLAAWRTKAPGHRCSLSVAFWRFKVKVIVSWKWRFCSPLLTLPITFHLFSLFFSLPKKYFPKPKHLCVPSFEGWTKAETSCGHPGRRHRSVPSLAKRQPQNVLSIRAVSIMCLAYIHF